MVSLFETMNWKYESLFIVTRRIEQINHGKPDISPSTLVPKSYSKQLQNDI